MTQTHAGPPDKPDYVEALVGELVQVAAVAVAAIEDLRFDVTQPDSMEQDIIIGEILAERRRQEKKWGPQHHGATFWMAILGEEYGEACQEALRSESDVIAAIDEANRRMR